MGSHKRSRSLAPINKNQNQLEALTGFGHIHSRWSQHLLPSFPQGCIMEHGSHCGNSGEKALPQPGWCRGWGGRRGVTFGCPGPVFRARPLDYLLQNRHITQSLSYTDHLMSTSPYDWEFETNKAVCKNEGKIQQPEDCNPKLNVTFLFIF